MSKGTTNYFRLSDFTLQDPKVIRAIEILGFDQAIARYLSILMLCSKSTEYPGQFEFTFRISALDGLWGTRRDNTRRCLDNLQIVGLLSVHYLGLLVRLSIPNFPKYKGRYDKSSPLNKGKESKVNKRKEKKEKENPPPSSAPPFLVDLWNTVSTNLPKVVSCSGKRLARCNRVIKEHPDRSYWEWLFAKVNSSPFLIGKNNRGWRADFDWVLKEDNRVKILEGKYDSVNSAVEGSAEFNSFLQHMEKEFKPYATRCE